MSPVFKAALAGLALAAGLAATGATAAPGPAYQTIAQAWTGLAPCLAPTGGGFDLPTTAGDKAARIAGVRFSGQSASALAAFRALSKRLRRADIPADCADVACATGALLPGTGDHVLNLALRHRYIAADRKQAWTADELAELSAAFDDLPADWFPADGKGYRLLVRHHGDMWSATPQPQALTLIAMAGAGLPGVLVADGWTALPTHARRAAIVHELAHEYARTRSGRFRRAWMAAMSEDRAAGRPDGVSAYADTNADEDFAESVAAYRYMAPALMRRAPARYAFLKAQVFGGLEYGSEAKCRRTEPAAFSLAD